MLRFRQFLLIGFFIAAAIVLNREALEEWLNITPQAPSAAIERLADATTMTRSAQRLFYRQHPSIESKATFLNQCKVPDKAIMLGCYVRRGRTGKIVIQNVTDNRLQGTMEVTAAHELLHAAYERLQGSEKRDIRQRLAKSAQRVTDPRLNKVLKDYHARNLTLYYNELHSHLGTELSNLGDARLEKYYQRYFTNRQNIVRLAKKSSFVLKNLEKTAERLKPEIDQLEIDLKQSEQALKQAERTLQASHRTLNSLEVELRQAKQNAEAAFQQGAPTALQLADEFEQRKANFNYQVAQHNTAARDQKRQVRQFNQRVKRYKEKIKEYNKIARESRNILENLTIKTD